MAAATHNLSRIRSLIESSEATVMVAHPERPYAVVGLKLDPSKCPVAAKVEAFNELLDLVEELLAKDAS